MGFRKFCNLNAETFFSGAFGLAGVFFLKRLSVDVLLELGRVTMRNSDNECLLARKADDGEPSKRSPQTNNAAYATML